MLDKSLLEEIFHIALDNGCDFAEVFAEYTTSNSIVLVNEKVDKSNYGIVSGVGIRLITGFNAIYTYTNNPSPENLKRVTEQSAKIAGKSKYKSRVMPFIDKKIEYKQKAIILPKSEHKKDAIERLREANITSKKVSNIITETSSSYMSKEQNVLIANSEGLYITDTRYNTRVSINSVASNINDKQTATKSPGIFGGAEILDNVDFVQLGKDTAHSAMTMLKADYMQSGTYPVVIDNGFGGVIFHEACGHSLEATSVSKGVSVFADKIGQKIANEKISAVDDGTLLNHWGSINVDDEGTPSTRNILIENGILKNYIVDNLGGKKMGMKSTGSARRESYKYAPTSRMTNTFIMNGNDKFEDMINSIEYGLFAKNMGGGSVQPTTGEFNFAVNEGYVIRNGKIAEPVRGTTLIGKGQEILMNIDMVSDNLEQAQGVCGSISGSVYTNVGQPSVRVSEITVGGR